MQPLGLDLACACCDGDRPSLRGANAEPVMPAPPSTRATAKAAERTSLLFFIVVSSFRDRSPGYRTAWRVEVGTWPITWRGGRTTMDITVKLPSLPHLYVRGG